MIDKYQPIIGIEVHIELKTLSKMFCGCSASYFGKPPNTLCCPVCLGMPGALPVPNEKAINWCRLIGLALNCQIQTFSRFDRKNYFYPDLPKGYQISQFYYPLSINGSVKLDSGKVININRVHMEEDTGKLIHQRIQNSDFTLIDFNRCGVPLVEIVSEPEIYSIVEAKEYLKKIQLTIRHLGVSDADMEKGSMRLEPNISLILKKDLPDESRKFQLPDYKVEIKNINSFKYAQDAISYELERQFNLLNKGNKVIQETRRWDENKKITYSQRIKEEAKDYRYFPEPDIPPFNITEQEINQLKKSLPNLPEQKVLLYEKMGLSKINANLLVNDLVNNLFFEKIINNNKLTKDEIIKIANLIINKKIDISKITFKELGGLLSTQNIVSPGDLKVIKNTCLEIIKLHPSQVKEYKEGKKVVLGFLIGLVLKRIQIKIAPQLVHQQMLTLLDSN